jgi:spore germination cell wall hydrolase CwlJ-like protein
MVALRPRPKGAVPALFGLSTFAFVLLPAPVGTQDLAALFSYQAEAAPWSAALTSSFGTIHPATYSFPRPVGTAIPRLAGYRLASLDPRTFDIGGAIRRDDGETESPQASAREFPVIDRRLKGDSLLAPASSAADVPSPAVEAAPSPNERTEDAHAALAPVVDDPVSGLWSEDAGVDVPIEDGVWPHFGPVELSGSHSPAMDTARLYFGTAPTGDAPGAFDLPLAEPTVMPSNVKLPPPRPEHGEAQADAGKGGETVAGKGEVTGTGKHPLSPAERLGLNAKTRAKAEKCLANAVYFEARGESVRGQIAVAQVVMNRVFSDFYPDKVCDVVYQNAHRHNACQFTFACDGIRDVVTEPDAWVRAKRIAKGTLDGKLWLDDVGKATHYHAYWVRPWWIRTMRKLDRIGVHTFYRPRRWGDGSDEPVWGDAKTTAALAKKL